MWKPSVPPFETAETVTLVFRTLQHTNSGQVRDGGPTDQPIPADEQPQIRCSLAEGLKGVVSQTLCKKKGGGRVAALEILMGSYALAANIRAKANCKQIPNFIQMGRKEGMCSLNDSLLDLGIESDIVEPAEASVPKGPSRRKEFLNSGWVRSRIAVRPRARRGPKKNYWPPPRARKP